MKNWGQGERVTEKPNINPSEEIVGAKEITAATAFTNIINGMLSINYSISHEEFCGHIVKLVKDEHALIANAFIESICHFLFCMLDETLLFHNYKYISSDIYRSPYSPTPRTLEGFIDDGHCSQKMFKVRFDGIKDSGINEIKVIIPDYLLGTFGIPNRNFFEKKVLKTKEVFYLGFTNLSLRKSSLLKLKESLPDNFFILREIKNNPINIYNDSYTFITEEISLPIPIVLYPHRGVIGFKSDLDSKDIFFCSCFKEAVENYIDMRLITGKIDNGIISHYEFPKEFVDLLSDYNFVINNNIINHFHFKDKICHECNQKMPRGYHSDNNTRISAKIGWYIDRLGLIYGINVYGDIILENKCPVHINEIDNNFKSIIKNATEIQKNQLLSRRERAIRSIIENEVRPKFGFEKIGESWISETALYYLIKEIFPNTKVIHNGKPEWLTPQHLDIWIPEWNIGIEYQGTQHYEPVSIFGGEKGLLKTKERDERKAKICRENQVKLILVNEGYAIEDVVNRIRETRE